MRGDVWAWGRGLLASESASSTGAESLVGRKVGFAALILGLGLLGGLLSLLLGDPKKSGQKGSLTRQRISLVNCFAGAVFAGTGLLHNFPHVLEYFADAGADGQISERVQAVMPFFLVLLGYYLVFMFENVLLEVVAESTRGERKTVHLHVDGKCGPGECHDEGLLQEEEEGFGKTAGKEEEDEGAHAGAVVPEFADNDGKKEAATENDHGHAHGNGNGKDYGNGEGKGHGHGHAHAHAHAHKGKGHAHEGMHENGGHDDHGHVHEASCSHSRPMVLEVCIEPKCDVHAPGGAPEHVPPHKSATLLAVEPRSTDMIARLHSRPKSLIPLFVFLSLSIHSILAGIALGVQDTAQGVDIVMVAICAHKTVAAFALAVSYLRNGASWGEVGVYLTSFSLITPVGVLIGLAVMEAGGADPLTSGVLEGLSVGTFIYVGLVQLVREEFSLTDGANAKTVALRFGMCILGFALISGIAFGTWTDEHADAH